MKNGKDVTRRFAGLELCREGMYVKIGLRLFLILFQRNDKNAAEIAGCGYGGSLGHIK